MPARRIVFLDVARALAVSFALSAHCMSTLGSWKVLGGHLSALTRLVEWSATPMFIVLFGTMLELVYYPRVARGGVGAVRPALFTRSLKCYAGYVATVVAAALGGYLTAPEALATGSLLGECHFSNILKYYAVAMILALPLFAFRRRFGLGAVVGLALGVWLLVPLLDLLPWPDRANPLSHVTVLFVGHPTHASAVSLLHSFSLVGVGMVLGHALGAGRQQAHWDVFVRAAVVVVAACAVVVVVLCVATSPHDVLRGYLSRHFRTENHVGYYAIGLLATTGLMLGLALLFPPATHHDPRYRPVFTLGQRSIFAYPLGNCLLNVWPQSLFPEGMAAVAASSAFPLLVGCLVIATDRAWDAIGKRLQPTAYGGTARVQRSTTRP